MLRRLHVRNYVLIDSLDIEFPEGLVIITGQTGAGKSIILGALGLALGAKADAAAIGENGGNCVVEAEFSFDTSGGALAALLEENEIDAPDGVLLIRRVVNPTGRSRAFVNDSPVTVQVLSSLASYLIDIHSQHQTMLLSDRQFRLSVLDMYAGNAALLDEYRNAYSALGHMKSELASLEASLARAKEDKEYNEARFAMLDAAALKEGELEELEAEQTRLANAEEIKENLCAAEELFSGDASGEVPGVNSMLKDIERHLEKVTRYLGQVATLSERLSSCKVELDDIVSEISAMNSGMEVSGERLQAVEDRISQLYGLMRKFGCGTVEELMAVRDSLSSVLGDTSEMESRREALAKELDAQQSVVMSLASRLHEAREKAASSFSSSIGDLIRYLELPYAVFRTAVLPAELSQTGSDAVSFLFSSTGKNPVDVSACASGGEMSRIMLSLKAMMARYMDMPAMIFDEIDTGVSGSAADRMGSMICDMGRNMQVFAITHLPQVAAKGDAHYLVSKDVDLESGRTVSTIKKLSAEQRVMEIARMLSGSVLTDAAIENARSLLGR